MPKLMRTLIISLLLLNCLTTVSNAFILMDNSYLVSTRNMLKSYDSSGSLIDEMLIPYPGGDRGFEEARDVIFYDSQYVAIFNGVFTPYVSIYDSLSDDWRHLSFTNWNIVSSTYNGGIANYKNFIFTGDMRTGGDSSIFDKGIIRFDLQNNSALRFAQGSSSNDHQFGDVVIGKDGKLYVLETTSTLGIIKVFNPSTMIEEKSIALPFGNTYTSIIVDTDGTIYAIALNSQLFILDNDGSQLAVKSFSDINNNPGQFLDINFFGDDLISVGTGSGFIVLMDKSLTELDRFRVYEPSPFYLGSNVAFHTYVNQVIPEPATMALFGTGLAGAFIRRRKRRKDSAGV